MSPITSRTRNLFISALLILISVLIWWINTVLAAILLIGAITLVTQSLCLYGVSKTSALMSYERESPRQSKSRYQRRVSEIERHIRRTIEKEMDDESIDIEIIAEFETEDELDLGVPLQVIEGIDDLCAEDLILEDINNIEDLAGEDEETISDICGVELEIAEMWIGHAKAITIGGKIKSVIELTVVNENELLTKITESLHRDEFVLPQDMGITLADVKSWVDRANRLTSEIDAEELKKMIEHEDNP